MAQDLKYQATQSLVPKRRKPTHKSCPQTSAHVPQHMPSQNYNKDNPLKEDPKSGKKKQIKYLNTKYFNANTASTLTLSHINNS